MWRGVGYTLGMEQEPKQFFENQSEQGRSIEVLTNSIEVIGPNSKVETLEVLPGGSCAVLTAYDPGVQVAGAAHLSFGLETEDVEGFIHELSTKLNPLGASISNSQFRLFRGGDILLGQLEKQLGERSPKSEGIPAEYQGLTLNKKTGEISFFSTFSD
ncbi:MAG: hypothetical protein JWN37_94 [Candidatus Nomurabacteria bacterium]|nr:hypothetical protein [Candidatus Nomurabacteria bacterium]